MYTKGIALLSFISRLGNIPLLLHGVTRGVICRVKLRHRVRTMAEILTWLPQFLVGCFRFGGKASSASVVLHRMGRSARRLTVVPQIGIYPIKDVLQPRDEDIDQDLGGEFKLNHNLSIFIAPYIEYICFKLCLYQSINQHNTHSLETQACNRRNCITRCGRRESNRRVNGRIRSCVTKFEHIEVGEDAQGVGK